MRLYLTLKNTQITLDSEIITDGFSYVQNYYNNLTSADNYVKCSIPFNVQIAAFIKANIDGDVVAVIKNDDDTNYFYGYLKKDSTFAKASRVDNIEIEIVSPSFYLDANFKNNVYFESKTLAEVVEGILSYSDITDVNLSALPSITLPIVAIQSGESIKSVLSEILKEYGFTYDFNQNGTFICLPVFNLPIAVVQEFKDSTNGNMLGTVTQKLSAKKYDGVSVQFDSIEWDNNVTLFDDTAEKTIPAGSYFDDNSNGIYLEYATEGKSVKYIKSINSWKISTDKGNISNTSPSSAFAEASMQNYYINSLMLLKNKSTSELKISNINIKGSGYFTVATNKTVISDGENVEKITAKYIHNSTDAESLARNLSNYYRYASSVVELTSKIDYEYGSFVRVTVANLGTVTGRIIQKTRTLKSSVIAYVIEAISDYTPVDDVTTEKEIISVPFRAISSHIVTLYKRSSTEIHSTGITGTLTYSFETNQSSWDGDSNGWVTDYSSLVGDGTVYITTATAYGRGATDTIASNEWAEPIPQGLNGENGYNSRTLQLFKRSSTTPTALPLDFTLDFTARDLIIPAEKLNGWVINYPAIDEDHNPLYEIHTTALSLSTVDTITTEQWSSPVLISQDAEVTKQEIQQMIDESIIDTAAPHYIGSYATAPDYTDYNLGDWYLNTTTGELYRVESDGWSSAIAYSNETAYMFESATADILQLAIKSGNTGMFTNIYTAGLSALRILFQQYVASIQNAVAQDGDQLISMGKDPMNPESNMSFTIQRYTQLAGWEKQFTTNFKGLKREVNINGDLFVGGEIYNSRRIAINPLSITGITIQSYSDIISLGDNYLIAATWDNGTKKGVIKVDSYFNLISTSEINARGTFSSDGHIFVLNGSVDNSLFYSYDGDNWDEVTLSYNPEEITYIENENRFIGFYASNRKGYNADYHLIYSNDGITWVDASEYLTINCTSIGFIKAYRNKVYINVRYYGGENQINEYDNLFIQNAQATNTVYSRNYFADFFIFNNQYFSIIQPWAGGYWECHKSIVFNSLGDIIFSGYDRIVAIIDKNNTLILYNPRSRSIYSSVDGIRWDSYIFNTSIWRFIKDIKSNEVFVTTNISSNEILNTLDYISLSTQLEEQKNELLLKNQNLYSTEETIVGTWYNGKPIYRAIIQGRSATIPAVTWTNCSNVDMTPYNIEQIIKGFQVNESGNITFTHGYRIYNNRLQEYCAWQTSVSTSIYFVIEYTKTTD